MLSSAEQYHTLYGLFDKIRFWYLFQYHSHLLRHHHQTHLFSLFLEMKSLRKFHPHLQWLFELSTPKVKKKYISKQVLRINNVIRLIKILNILLSGCYKRFVDVQLLVVLIYFVLNIRLKAIRLYSYFDGLMNYMAFNNWQQDIFWPPKCMLFYSVKGSLKVCSILFKFH